MPEWLKGTSFCSHSKLFLLIIHKLFILFLMDAYSELIMNFTDRLLRSNEEIGILNNKISSLHKELSAAKKEIEASKIHSIKAPTKRKDALSRKILDFIEGHAQTEINAKLIMLSLDIPVANLNSVYVSLCIFCKQGILRRVRPGVYIKTATS